MNAIQEARTTMVQNEDLIRRLAKSLEDATRYIEVQQAYRGCMTPAQVEEAVAKNRSVSRVEIGANSVCTLASFDIHRSRALIEEARR
jgi:hypothetical protein